MKTTIKKVLAILLVITTLTTLCSCSIGKKKVDFKDYITVEYDGFNGYASAHLDYDLSSLNELVDEKKWGNFAEELTELKGDDAKWTLAFVSGCDDFFEMDLEEYYQNLSNGDTIIVNVSVSGDMEYLGVTLEDIEDLIGIKIKNTVIEIEVEGLVDAKTIDLFADVESYIDYNSGYDYPINGKITPEIHFDFDGEKHVDNFTLSKYNASSLVVSYNGERIGVIEFEISKIAKNLSEGNSFTITLVGYEILEEYGYMPLSLTTTLTVPEAADAITSKSQITPEVLQQLKSLVLDNKKGKDQLKIDECYFYTKKSGANEYEKKENGVLIVHSWVEPKFFGGEYTPYHVAIFELCIMPDGTVSLYKADYDGYVATSLDSIHSRMFDYTNFNYEKF